MSLFVEKEWTGANARAITPTMTNYRGSALSNQQLAVSSPCAGCGDLCHNTKFRPDPRGPVAPFDENLCPNCIATLECEARVRGISVAEVRL